MNQDQEIVESLRRQSEFYAANPRVDATGDYCESFEGPASGNHEWHGHIICGDCFADVPAGELSERING